MAEQVDAQDLKSCGLRNPCQFDSGSGHHFLSKKEKNTKKAKKLLKLDKDGCYTIWAFVSNTNSDYDFWKLDRNVKQ